MAISIDESESRLVKILFKLEQDDDGYPPATTEGIWAEPLTADRFTIQNIPFFVHGISWGDVVKATFVEGEWWFEEIVHFSTHTTLRLFVADEAHVGPLEEQLDAFGCSWEEAYSPELIAVDIPLEAQTDELLGYLYGNAHEGYWEIENASLR